MAKCCFMRLNGCPRRPVGAETSMRIWLITVKPKVIRDYGNTVGSSITVETATLEKEILLTEDLVFYRTP